MSKARLISILFSVLILALASNVCADDVATQVTQLEQKANLLQTQIDQAKASSQNQVNQQVQSLRNSIDVLIKQRVAVDAQIAQFEGQIEEINAKSKTNLDRQVAKYGEDLMKVKSQLSSILGDKKKQVSAPPTAVQNQVVEQRPVQAQQPVVNQ